jgi:hypothetical protein
MMADTSHLNGTMIVSKKSTDIPIAACCKATAKRSGCHCLALKDHAERAGNRKAPGIAGIPGA